MHHLYLATRTVLFTHLFPCTCSANHLKFVVYIKKIKFLCLTDRQYLNTIHHLAVLSASLCAVLYFTSSSVT